MKSYYYSLIFTLLTLPLLTSCSGGESDSSSVNSNLPSLINRESPQFSGPSELSTCSPTSVGAGAITISGSATFQKREIFNSGLSRGLGAPGSPKPIRHAEVRIVDSSSNVVQCGDTDGTGSFSLEIPNSGDELTVMIISRANNNFLKASILEAPENNKLYSLAVKFSADASKNVGTLNALATGNNFGAAFNMLDLIFEANEFLRNEVGNCSSQLTGCVDFTVAEKVSVYWENGFNPNSYFDAPDSGLSFYYPTDGTYSRRLFILGGINGDVNNSDTDHYDDSVILHEYGHFLEDVYSVSDSQGGPHGGTRPIDPRLAFSEAWGNFFQAAVLNSPSETSPIYIDTIGNIDGETDFILAIPLEQVDASCASNTGLPGCDLPTTAGEGHYREFAITRTLWDIYDSVNDSESVTGAFNELWATITDGNGYTNTNLHHFRSAGLVHQIQSTSLTPNTDWSAVRGLAGNLQTNDRTHYAQTLTTGVSCGTRNFNISPINDGVDSSNSNASSFEFLASNLFFNNDFFHIYHPGGPIDISLEWVTSSGVEADLDLFLYSKAANYGNPGDMVTYARSLNSTSSAGNVEIESISDSNLTAGNYLINVKVKSHLTSSDGDSTSYELNSGGVQLCP